MYLTLPSQPLAESASKKRGRQSPSTIVSNLFGQLLSPALLRDALRVMPASNAFPPLSSAFLESLASIDRKNSFLVRDIFVFFVCLFSSIFRCLLIPASVPPVCRVDSCIARVGSCYTRRRSCLFGRRAHSKVPQDAPLGRQCQIGHSQRLVRDRDLGLLQYRERRSILWLWPSTRSKPVCWIACLFLFLFFFSTSSFFVFAFMSHPSSCRLLGIHAIENLDREIHGDSRLVGFAKTPNSLDCRQRNSSVGLCKAQVDARGPRLGQAAS